MICSISSVPYKSADLADFLVKCCCTWLVVAILTEL